MNLGKLGKNLEYFYLPLVLLTFLWKWILMNIEVTMYTFKLSKGVESKYYDGISIFFYFHMHEICRDVVIFRFLIYR